MATKRSYPPSPASDPRRLRCVPRITAARVRPSRTGRARAKLCCVHFTLEDVDAMSAFVTSNGLAGVHYWSYDRDTDCAAGSASATCNTMGSGYAGDHGYLKRFQSAGL